MDYLVWIGLFLLTSIFWGWVLFLGGADWLEGSFLAGLVFHFRATAWTADGIRAFVVIAWLGETIWFVIGLFSRDVRQFSMFWM